MADNMSFLPEDYLARRVARRTNVICITLFVVVMVGVVAAFFVTDRQRSEIREQQAQVNQKFEEAARRLDQLEELQAQKQQMVRKAKVASVLVERVPRTLVLAELINQMPTTLSLTEMELETETLRAARRPRTAIDKARSKAKEDKQDQFVVTAPETRVTVRMAGVAPTDVEVAQYITALSDHVLFQDVILEYAEQATVDDREMRKFGLELTVNQDADLRKIESTQAARDLKMDPMGDSLQISATGELVTPDAADTPPAVAAPAKAGGPGGPGGPAVVPVNDSVGP